MISRLKPFRKLRNGNGLHAASMQHNAGAAERGARNSLILSHVHI